MLERLPRDIKVAMDLKLWKKKKWTFLDVKDMFPKESADQTDRNKYINLSWQKWTKQKILSNLHMEKENNCENIFQFANRNK